MIRNFFWCHKPLHNLARVAQRKWTLVSEWSHQCHVNEANSGKGQEPLAALTRRGRGTPALPLRVQVGQSTSTCRL